MCIFFLLNIRFLNRFQQTSDLHKEMLAILSAITEVIKERNGTQSSTEFFLGLVSIQTLDDIFMLFYVYKWNDFYIPSNFYTKGI